jgi:DnaJ-class molecular chaperone
MKKPRVQPSERACPGCNGTGLAPVKEPTRPGVRVYPPHCKECGGKGKVAD